MNKVLDLKVIQVDVHNKDLVINYGNDIVEKQKEEDY